MKLNKKMFKFGGYATVVTIVLIVAVVLVNVGVSTLETSFYMKYDATSNRRYSISEQTKKVASELDEDITIYTTYSSGRSFDQLDQILSRYAQSGNKRIKVENIDPIRDPQKVLSFSSTGTSIAEGSVIVAGNNDKKFRVITYLDMFMVDEATQTATEFVAENKITAAIMYITSDSANNAYFLSGQGEPSLSSLAYVRSALESENYNVTELNLQTSDVELQPEDIVLIVAPTTDLIENDRLRLKTFLEKGGKLFMALDPLAGNLEGFNSLLGLYNVKTMDGVLWEGDIANYYQPNPNNITPKYYTGNAIGSLLASTRSPCLFPNAGAFSIPDQAPPNVVVEPILLTSEKAWLDINSSGTVDGEEREGVHVPAIAVYYDKNANPNVPATQVVAFQNADFLLYAPQMVGFQNEELFINSIGWLTKDIKETDALYIRGKTLRVPSLNFSSAGQQMTVLVILWPVFTLVILGLGVWMYLRRKHL